VPPKIMNRQLRMGPPAADRADYIVGFGSKTSPMRAGDSG
jgi:hypothetical protein